MTPTERKRLRELAEKASSAPWHIGHVSEIDDGSYEIDASNGELICDNELPENGLFIIAARTAVPQLLDLVEELEKALEFYSIKGNYETGPSTWFDRSQPFKDGFHSQDFHCPIDSDRGRRANEALRKLRGSE